MRDRIFESFLDRQYEQGMALAASTPLLDLLHLDHQHYAAVFHCKGFVRRAGGVVEAATGFEAGIYFGPDHLRRLQPIELVTWFGPDDVWSPHIRPPFVCLGHVTAGVGLVDLLYQLFEIITWRRVALHDALNPEAAQWGRRNRDRFPVEDRPLRARELRLKIRRRETGT